MSQRASRMLTTKLDPEMSAWSRTARPPLLPHETSFCIDERVSTAELPGRFGGSPFPDELRCCSMRTVFALASVLVVLVFISLNRHSWREPLPHPDGRRRCSSSSFPRRG